MLGAIAWLCVITMLRSATALADLPEYACTNGTHPESVCASTQPPGGYAPAQVPQIVLISFDDSVTTASYPLVTAALEGYVNPNGDPIRATFFVSLDGKFDPVSIHQLWAQGHEIAVHTITHRTSTNTSFEEWRNDVVGGRWYLSQLAAIPESEIRGFRAPYLQPNDAAYQVLHAWGFDYDSSLPERFSGLSTAPSNMIWPYTFDNGVGQVVPASAAPTQTYAGLFEVPLYAHAAATGGVATVMDPPEDYDANEVAALWRTNFLAHYHGNRAPFGLALHATTSNQWFSNTNHPWRPAALRDFIEWALAQGTDVWFVSYSDAIEFMRAPFDSAAALTAALFRTTLGSTYPPDHVSTCSYPEGKFEACGFCPPTYPSTAHVFLVLGAPITGVVSCSMVSQDVQRAYGVLLISNSTAQTRYDWDVEFELATGCFEQCYAGVYTQVGTRVTIRSKPYNKQLSAGQTLSLQFAVRNEGCPFDILSPVARIWGLEFAPPNFVDVAVESHGIRLAWAETAYAFDVETADTLSSEAVWTVITANHRRAILEMSAGSEHGRFWRVRNR